MNGPYCVWSHGSHNKSEHRCITAIPRSQRDQKRNQKLLRRTPSEEHRQQKGVDLKDYKHIRTTALNVLIEGCDSNQISDRAQAQNYNHGRM